MTKTVVGRHKVGDFDTWLKGHQDRERAFSPAVSSFKTFRDADDPNTVVLVFEVTDMEKFEAILKDPSSEVLKKKHTVKDPVKVSIQIEL
ncbi:hypothetical protein [Gelidibacter salicanalis]|uniref:Uncharacterized protein n=1 Tax=Gelidibacter salicanalis TaxID=291193 RepID=A0A934NKI3_9FLAO|nr:hypothetical protein [Gelidibacter salicanalis]MBJ7880742.1 hypothetical protein [Gelidibacter salicanalis]